MLGTTADKQLRTLSSKRSSDRITVLKFSVEIAFDSLLLSRIDAQLLAGTNANHLNKHFAYHAKGSSVVGHKRDRHFVRQFTSAAIMESVLLLVAVSCIVYLASSSNSGGPETQRTLAPPGGSSRSRARGAPTTDSVFDGPV